jgi:hypothetical protein
MMPSGMGAITAPPAVGSSPNRAAAVGNARLSVQYGPLARSAFRARYQSDLKCSKNISQAILAIPAAQSVIEK